MAAIANAPAVSISAETYLETGIVIDARNSPALSRAFDDLLVANASLSVLDADLSGLPPACIQTGEADILMSGAGTLAERLGH
jgi:acetyl esterase/lipase